MRISSGCRHKEICAIYVIVLLKNSPPGQQNSSSKNQELKVLFLRRKQLGQANTYVNMYMVWQNHLYVSYKQTRAPSSSPKPEV